MVGTKLIGSFCKMVPDIASLDTKEETWLQLQGIFVGFFFSFQFK